MKEKQKKKYAFMSDKYGDWIVFKPQFNIQNSLLDFALYCLNFWRFFHFIFFFKKDNKTIKETVHINYLVVFLYEIQTAYIFTFFFITFSFVRADQSDTDISFYTGTFDIIDKEGDDQTTLFGVEHKNPNLFEILFRKV